MEDTKQEIKNSKDFDSVLEKEVVTKVAVQEAFLNGYPLVSELRQHSTWTLGVLLTAVEAALGDTKQAEALKAIVRREMHFMIDRNQAAVHERTGQQKPGLAPREINLVGQDGNEIEE